MVAVVEHYGGNIFFDSSLIKHRKSTYEKRVTTKRIDKEYKQVVRARKMAMAFLLSANKKVYGSLLDKLSDLYSFNINVYPKTLNLVNELYLSSMQGNTRPTKDPSKRKVRQRGYLQVKVHQVKTRKETI